MTQKILLTSKHLFFSLLLISTFVLSSCKVTFIPSYDSEISDHIETTSKEVDKFYLSMLETTNESGDNRMFNKFSKGYVDIEVELNSLLNKNEIRPLNKNSVRICEITLGLWQKYKEEHKTDNTLSDGLIKLNRKTFSDLFFAMQVAEKGKQIVDNPPQ